MSSSLSAPAHVNETQNLFSGVVASATKIFSPSSQILSGALVEFGGQRRQGLCPELTHFFSDSDDSEQYNSTIQIKRVTGSLKVLVPNWFDHTLRLGDPNLETSSYEWATPSTVLRPVPVYPNLNPSDITDIWQCKRLLLSRSLELIEPMKHTVEFWIRRCNGIILDPGTTDEQELAKVDECDIYIIQTRCKGYLKARLAGKTIGTVAWLLHVQQSGVISSSLHHLLHYPVPDNYVPGITGSLFAITKYTGAAREYLQTLIHLLGGEYTGTVSKKNFVVIAASHESSKTMKAEKLSIPVVSHRWLEECFRRWKYVSTSVPEFTVDLSATGDIHLVQKDPVITLDEIDLESEPIEPHVIEDVNKHSESATIPEPREAQVAQCPVSLGRGELDNGPPVYQLNPIIRFSPSPAPEITRSRSSSLSSIDSFEFRPNGAVSGKRKALDKKENDEEEESESTAKKRKLSHEDTATEESESEDNHSRDSHSSVEVVGRKTSLTGNQVLGGSRSRVRRQTRGMYASGLSSDRAHSKFYVLAGIRAIHSLEQLAARCLLPEEDYHLVDKKGELKYGVSLQKSISNAREREGRLLEGMTFHWTGQTAADSEALIREIVEANGGTVKRLTAIHSSRVVGPANHYLISCEQDRAIWKPLTLKTPRPRIYTPELLLRAALRQEALELENTELQVPGSFD
ncbi:hypothetical protein C8J56DRAFT_1140554 [Mycena floridula]|nr:hypothetical protein C8J56DRAFT_1140554 [Mycena floridula]